MAGLSSPLDECSNKKFNILPSWDPQDELNDVNIHHDSHNDCTNEILL